MGSSPFARTVFRDRGVFPGLFFYAPAGGVQDKRSGPRGFVPLCHCVTSPEGERKRLSPFRSLARYLEVEECSPVSFFAPASEVRDNRSGPRGFVPLCHCVTSPGGERKRLSPFRSLARYQEVEECSPVSFFMRPRVEFGTIAQGLAASYPSVTA